MNNIKKIDKHFAGQKFQRKCDHMTYFFYIMTVYSQLVPITVSLPV